MVTSHFAQDYVVLIIHFKGLHTFNPYVCKINCINYLKFVLVHKKGPYLVVEVV